jgi:hypothetical protein
MADHRTDANFQNGKKAKKVVIPQSNFLVSTKMKAMMDEIKRIAVESDNTEKTIVGEWSPLSLARRSQ